MIDLSLPVRFSNLKRMAQSPAHYLAAAQDQKPHLERGSALHSLVLGGKEVIAYPGKVRRGKEWEAFQADHPESLILTQTESGRTFAMAAAVQANKLAMTVLEGRHELEIDWSLAGRAMQAHVDVVGPGNAYVTELKGTQCGAPDRFAHLALRYAYHAQLASYMDAVASSGEGEPREAYVVAVESSAPYVVTTLRLTERALDQGRRLFRLWFERLRACEESGEWPGYAQSIVPLDAPEDELELIFGASQEVASVTDEAPF
jgi:hypothetical protein